MDEACKDALRLDYDRRLKLEFHSAHRSEYVTDRSQKFKECCLMFALRKSICYLCFLALLVHALLSCSRSHADEKSFPAENDIFTIGMVSLDHIDKCGVNVLGWSGSLQRPEQRKWFARCVDFTKRHQMRVILSLSIFNAEWKTYEQRPELVTTCCKDIEGNMVRCRMEIGCSARRPTTSSGSR